MGEVSINEVDGEVESVEGHFEGHVDFDDPVDEDGPHVGVDFELEVFHVVGRRNEFDLGIGGRKRYFLVVEILEDGRLVGLDELRIRNLNLKSGLGLRAQLGVVSGGFLVDGRGLRAMEAFLRDLVLGVDVDVLVL